MVGWWWWWRGEGVGSVFVRHVAVRAQSCAAGKATLEKGRRATRAVGQKPAVGSAR